MHDEGCWREADELLTAGQYERLAELLHEAQVAIERRGDAIPVHVLVLARRICLACSQSQAEADWHQQAREEAAQREEKLRQQLCTLLDLASGRDLSEVPGEWEARPSFHPVEIGPPAPGLPEPADGLSLWQRIQGVMGWRLARQPPEISGEEVTRPAGMPMLTSTMGTEPPTRPHATESGVPAPPPVEQVKIPAAPSTEEAKMPPSRQSPVPPVIPSDREMEQAPPLLTIYCLGPFRVYQDDQPVEHWPSSKGKAIFKYLVTHRERPVVKEVLMELFWPGAAPDAARNNLNVAVYGLREAFRKTRPSFSHVLFQDDCYLLNPDLQIWVDCEAFVEHVMVARALEQRGDLAVAMNEYRVAEALYQGEFLEEDRYEDWPCLQRQRFQEDYLRLLDCLSRYYFDQGDNAACATVCRKMLAVDACREEAHRRLMRCYNRQGQPYLALRQYHLCVEALREELDAPPTQKITTLYEQTREGKRALPG
jgi:DNA-binding SARP family transcriptional activator